MRRLLLACVVLLACVALYAYSRSDLKEAINGHWPPVTIDQQRQKAVDAAFAALLGISAPNAALGVDLDVIETVGADQLKGLGITNIKVVADKQLVKVDATFDVTLGGGSKIKIKSNKWLDTFTPRIEGEIESYFGVQAIMVAAPKRALEVKLLPSLKHLSVRKVTVAGSYDVTQAADAIVGAVNEYADNISAAVADLKILHTELPASLQTSVNPAELIKPVSKESELKISISSKPIARTYGLRSYSVLIDGHYINLIGEIVAGDGEAIPAAVEGKQFRELQALFNTKLSGEFDLSLPPAANVWIAVSKKLLSDSLNSAVTDAQLCAHGSGPINVDIPGTEIPTPDPKDIDCSLRKDCTPHQVCDLQVDQKDCRRPPSCQHNHDTRECSTCLVSAFGRCQLRGNDPGCEAAKAAKNVTYDTEYSACINSGFITDAVCEAEKGVQNGLYATAKAQCETVKKATSVSCEGEKTASRLACEGPKGIVSLFHQTGNVGGFNGSVAGQGHFDICMPQISLSENLAAVKTTLEITGSAGLDTHFKFTPHDVAGHILCQFPWTADKHIDVTIPKQRVGVNVALALASEANEYKGMLEATSIHLHFEPSPLSLILKNINFVLACPVTAELINGLTLNLAVFVPDILKDYQYKLHPLEFKINAGIPEQTLNGYKIKPVLTETKKAVMASGKVERVSDK